MKAKNYAFKELKDKNDKEDFVEFKYGDTNRKFFKDIDEFDRHDWDLIDPRTYPKAPHCMID